MSVCKYLRKRSISEAPHCSHADCWARYWKTFPSRFLIVKKAVESGMASSVEASMGKRFLKHFERFNAGHNV